MTVGDLDNAVRWLRFAVERNRAFGAEPYAAASQADLADALLRRGDDPAEAAGLLAAAAATAGRLGMDRIGDRIRLLRGDLPDDRKDLPDDDDRALARAVAVLGAEADKNLLAGVCELPADRFLAAVGRGPHPAPEITADERRTDLLRAAAAIERLGLRRVHLDHVARFRVAALPAGDPVAAVGVALEAARTALRLFRPSVAAGHCRAALEAVAPYGQQAREWRAELLTVLGTAQAAMGENQAATENLAHAADLADLAAAPTLAIEAVLHMPLDARYEAGGSGPVEAALRARLDGASAACRVRIMARLGADVLAARPGSGREREQLVDRAVTEARALGDEVLLAEALSAWLRTVLGPDRIEERLTVGATTAELALRHRLPAAELQARLSLFTTLLTTGRVEQAEAELHRYEKLATSIDAPMFLMYARSRRATLATLRGEFADAERLIRQACEAGRAVTPDGPRLSQLQAFALGWALGRVDDEACAAAVRRTAVAYELMVAMRLHADGRLDEARRSPCCAGRSPSTAASVRCPFVAVGAHDLAEVLLRHGGAGEAAEASAARAEAESLAAKLGVKLPAAARPATPGVINLSREGDSWRLTYRGRSSALRHSKGLAQLAVLLANPGRDITAVELAGGVDTTYRMLVVDDTTLADCQRKLVALKARMANGDEAAAVEYDKVARYVKRATGLRGRTRYFSDDSERARVNVTRTVRQATDYILTIDADAGRYLHGTIRTGARCCYRPDGAD